MWTSALTALLLPLGIWLVISAATPKHDENRIAISGLLTILATTLAYVLFGFAFAFGGVGGLDPQFKGLSRAISIPIENQSWRLLGSSGFGLVGVGVASLSLFIPHLALAQTCALLANAAIVRRAALWVHALVAVVLGGLVFAVVSHWQYIGWLSSLGRFANLGHGVVDIGGLATAALVASTFGLLVAYTIPKRAPNNQLPPSFFPMRAVAGVLCAFIGQTAFIESFGLHAAFAEQAVFGFLRNAIVASAIAGMFAIAYTKFVTQRADSLCAARAVLAALVCTSAGAGLLPVGVAVLMGLCAGALATVGLFWVREKLMLNDDNALVTTLFAPAVLGLLGVGLFANGNLGAGLNQVGAEVYLGQASLGVVGLLGADPGQLTAQVVGLIGTGGMALFASYGLVLAFNQYLLQERSELLDVALENGVTQPAANPIQPEPQKANKPAETLAQPEAIPVAEEVFHSVATERIFEQAVAAQTAKANPTRNYDTRPVQTLQSVRVVEFEPKPRPPDTLLERLRNMRKTSLPPSPARARKVAYPVRVGGKPLARPLVEERKPDDSQNRV